MLVPESQHELTTPRIAPLCDPLGSPIRFVEADFPLFLNSDCGRGFSLRSVLTVDGVIFVNLRLYYIPINRLACRPYLGTLSRMKW